MGKYKKKPIVIEAVKYNGNNIMEIINFVDKNPILIGSKGILIIKTLEGNMKAPIGSYIVRGVEGEYYPCRGDIFEKTYEEVKEYV